MMSSTEFKVETTSTTDASSSSYRPVGVADNESTTPDGKNSSSLHVDNNALEEPILFVKGEIQTPEYRDVYFAYAFLLQLVGVFVTFVMYAPVVFQEQQPDDNNDNSNRALQDNTDSNNGGNQDADDDDLEFRGNSFMVLVLLTFGAAIVATMGTIQMMTKCSNLIVQLSFASAPILLSIMSLIFFTVDVEAGTNLMITAIVFGAISACVYICYRRFVPFAASTLRSAVSALQYQPGLHVLSLLGLVLTFITSMVYVFSVLGIYMSAEAHGEKVPCKDLYPDETDMFQDGEMCLKDPPNIFFMVLLLLSLFWTQQVIQNVVHCTTAGTVGTWWFSGEEDMGGMSLCCGNNHDMVQSLRRATTYSFGSICFGSLLVAILQTLEEMAKSARRNRRGALLACIIECILFCMRAWLEYFNSWAFCYVGLYGYDYLTAGKNVIALFKNRGWSSFISDRLIFRVLYCSYLAIGLFTGAVAALVDTIYPVFDSSSDDDAKSVSHIMAFFLGLFLGLILSRCSLFVVESAVRTVIVCFAESPGDFQQHHPTLCQDMRAGWAAAYPEVWVEEYDLRFTEVSNVIVEQSPQGGMTMTTTEEKKGLMV